MIPQIIAGEAISKVASNKYTPWVIGGVVILGLGFTYFAVARPLLCKFNVIECKRSRKEDNLEIDIITSNAFNPDYATSNMLTITFDRAKQLADQIYDSFGIFNDDEEAIYGAIQSAGSIANLSLVSRMYQARHGDSLGAEIANSLNTEEMNKVIQIIKNFKR